jgi:mRNA degradation ribonuclease J1/J2
MKEVYSKISQITKQTSGLVLADFAWGDINRLNSFYRATRQNNRLLAVAMKQAHLTDNLSKDPNLRVPDLAKKEALISRKAKKRYFGWEQEALKRGRVVDSSEIAKM